MTFVIEDNDNASYIASLLKNMGIRFHYIDNNDIVYMYSDDRYNEDTYSDSDKRMKAITDTCYDTIVSILDKISTSIISIDRNGSLISIVLSETHDIEYEDLYVYIHMDNPTRYYISVRGNIDDILHRICSKYL